MSNFKNSVQYIPMTSFNSASLSSSYQAINASGFPNQLLSMTITNASSVGITVSFDGTTDHKYVLANSSLTQSSNAISSQTEDSVKHPKGRVVYVKGTAGTGNIYLSGFYVATN